MINDAINTSRVIGFDAHPDSFTAAILSGPTPAAAVVEKMFNKVPMNRLLQWAKKNTLDSDIIVLEASGNSFHIARSLRSAGREASVLESRHIGKLKEAHANNDKISAIRIGKAYLAGTAKIVWIPDETTQERRDTFHTYSKAVKPSTQVTNRIKSYLSDHGVRLKSKTHILNQKESIMQACQWSPRERLIIEGMLMDLQNAQSQRAHWNHFMAQEVLHDPLLLSLTRLTGVREIVAYSIGAIIGDINRFASPKKLVAYIGLNPAFDKSGEGEWNGGIKGHGRRDLRSHLIEAAQSILQSNHDLGRWGKKLMARKGSRNLAVAAVARKLAVAIWYLMKGLWSTVEEVEAGMKLKIGKMIGKMGKEGLSLIGKTRKEFKEEIEQNLKKGREYILDRARSSPLKSSLKEAS
jgi:transposase